MEGYCLKNGTLQPALDRAEGIVPAAIYHLSPDGSWRRMPDIPPLQKGEGLLVYAGDFCIVPVEIQVEFIKAADGKQWLQGLVLRHVERMRQIDPSLYALAEIKEEAQ
mgnify:FL=1